ncbi:hypothetical protein K437DRAFT_71731 [Tilletiaria anomala UBC 951]|uniref:Endosomal/vacuolar adapter protein YPT35 n=1 Tax=Tilletiaria anomala (strain ATCC 24038 / CBS 436.72 / UBC 951) TaxID=1037660 RepID=A0A066WRZ7_TILAU|nr:uncharacterized protein K437DRAFT_71731 [Tilletiaria anomala UBC 951]KDN53440.1 hypothetical protein K437DRAFT_71731 [Tilletiaria anomala UBC 951]
MTSLGNDGIFVAELEEATSELLDLALPSPRGTPSQSGKARIPTGYTIDRLITPSPLRLTSPAPIYSAGSKLVPIRSFEDEKENEAGPSKAWSPRTMKKVHTQSRGDGGTSPEQRAKAKITISSSNEIVADQDWLPSGGLYSMIGSLREVTPIATPLPAPDRSVTGSPTSIIPPRSPFKDAHGTLKDVWLNEFGERVVNGKVVGQMRAGRRRAQSPTTVVSGTTSAPPSQMVFRQRQEITEIREEEKTQRQATTPAFFFQSFPTAVPGRRRSLDLSDPLKLNLSMQNESEMSNHTPDVSFHTANDSVEDTSLPVPTAERADFPLLNTVARNGSVLPAPPSRPISRSSSIHGVALPPSPLPISPLSSPAAPVAVTHVQSKLIKLHANKKKSWQTVSATQAGLVMEQDRDRNRLPTPTQTSPSLPPAAPMSIAARAAALFKTPLIPDERRRNSIGSYEDEGGAMLRSFSMPSSPDLSWRAAAGDRVHNGKGKADDGNDTSSQPSIESLPASLQSLPVSILTVSSLTPSAISDRSQGSNNSVGHHRRNSSRGSLRGCSSSVFAREVRIRGWSEVGEKARGWVVFHIRIVTKQGVVIANHRRFSAFVSLHRQLLDERPEYARFLPALPPRRTGLLHKYGAKHLENRRKSLQDWLESVMLDARWAECTCLQEWIL